MSEGENDCGAAVGAANVPLDTFRYMLLRFQSVKIPQKG